MKSQEEVKQLKAEIKRLKSSLSKLTPSLDIMLKRRGFSIYRKQSSGDLLLPEKKYINSFYNKLNKYSFRLFLRDVINNQQYFTIENVSGYSTKEIASEYINFLIVTRLAEYYDGGYRLGKRPIKSFGETLEWFVAGIMKNDFHLETAWGVKFKRPGVGGDYDLISKINSSILYMEIKSSPPKQLFTGEIKAFFDRAEDLKPDISIFFVDTELRMKDKVVPMFRDELKKRYRKNISIKKIKKELFHINKKIFIINSKGSTSSNIGTVLSFWLLKDNLV